MLPGYSICDGLQDISSNFKSAARHLHQKQIGNVFQIYFCRWFTHWVKIRLPGVAKAAVKTRQ